MLETVLPQVPQKLNLLQKWSNLISFLIFYLFTVYFQIRVNIKAKLKISQGNSEKPVPFPRIEVLLMKKKPMCIFFLSDEVYFVFNSNFILPNFGYF